MTSLLTISNKPRDVVSRRKENQVSGVSPRLPVNVCRREFLRYPSSGNHYRLKIVPEQYTVRSTFHLLCLIESTRNVKKRIYDNNKDRNIFFFEVSNKTLESSKSRDSVLRDHKRQRVSHKSIISSGRNTVPIKRTNLLIWYLVLYHIVSLRGATALSSPSLRESPTRDR